MVARGRIRATRRPVLPTRQARRSRQSSNGCNINIETGFFQGMHSLERDVTRNLVSRHIAIALEAVLDEVAQGDPAIAG